MNGPDPAHCLRLERLGKDFGKTCAVDAVSLDIAEGELYCLLGGSGCGKSTLLRLVAGLECPTRGRILLDGVDLTGVPPHRRPVNLVFQSYALFPHLTVVDNIAFGLRQERLPRATIARRVEDMLQLVHLGHLGGRRPRQLSGGQRQRVALARALVKQPRLLLLDEPLAALDRKLREATRGELLRIQRELGTTFVMVTHDQEEALSLASRIGVMADGRIVQSGTPREIYEQPATRLVAEFVGNANLLEVRVDASGGSHVALATAVATSPLRAPAAGTPHSGPAWLLLRPEQITIVRGTPSDKAVNTLAATTEEVVYAGDRRVYTVRLADSTRWRVNELNAAHRGVANLERGAKVTLTWPYDAGRVLTQ